MTYEKLPDEIKSPITGLIMKKMPIGYPNNNPNIVVTDYDGDYEYFDSVAIYKNEDTHELLYYPIENF